MKKLLTWMLILMLTLTAGAETLSGWELRAEDIAVTVDGESYPLDLTPVLWGAKEEGRFTGGFRVGLGDRILLPMQADLTPEGLGLRWKESSKYLLSNADEASVPFTALSGLPLSREKLWADAVMLTDELDALNLAPGETKTLPMADILARLEEALPEQEAQSCLALARMLLAEDILLPETVQGDSLASLGEALGWTGDVEIERNAEDGSYILTLADAGLCLRIGMIDASAQPPMESSPEEVEDSVESSIGIIGGADGPTSIFVASGDKLLTVYAYPADADFPNDGDNFIMLGLEENAANLVLMANETEKTQGSQTVVNAVLILDKSNEFWFHMTVNCEQEEVTPYYSSPYQETLAIRGVPADIGLAADVSYLRESEYDGNFGVTFHAALSPADVEDGMADARVVTIAVEDEYSFYDTGLNMAVIGWMGDSEAILNAESFQALSEAMLAQEKAAHDAYMAGLPEEEPMTIEDFPDYTLPDGFELVSEEVDVLENYNAQWQDEAGNTFSVVIYSTDYPGDRFEYSVSSSEATAAFYASNFHFRFSAPEDILTYDAALALRDNIQP